MGPGCTRCESAEKNVFNACAELDQAAELEHVRDVREFAGLGVWTTPAVVLDGKVAVSGRVPAFAELKRFLRA